MSASPWRLAATKRNAALDAGWRARTSRGVGSRRLVVPFAWSEPLFVVNISSVCITKTPMRPTSPIGVYAKGDASALFG